MFFVVVGYGSSLVLFCFVLFFLFGFMGMDFAVVVVVVLDFRWWWWAMRVVVAVLWFSLVFSFLFSFLLWD